MNSRHLVPWRLSVSATCFLCVAIIAGFTVPGCGGCKKEDPIAKKKRLAEEKKKAEERKRKKKAEEPKPNFELALNILPNYEIDPAKEAEKEREKEKEEEANSIDDPTRSSFTYVKPAHWVQGINTVKANNFDFQARLRTAPIGRGQRPLDIERTNYQLSMFRPAVLPKGQSKQIDTLFYLPRRDRNLTAYDLRSELLSARGGGTQHMGSRLGTALDEHQYFFVVLAANNSSYVFLNGLKSMVVSEDKISSFGDLRYYHVILPKIDRRVPVPNSLPTWTMIAAVLWDDIDPALMTEEQRMAMLDWLHWGGQLIVSGPNSLDKLKGSFLSPYLPATAGAVRKLQQADIDPLSEYWSLGSMKNPVEGRKITVIADKPMLGVELKMDPRAQFVPNTGDLVAERRVGAGRIVVSSFALTDLRIRYWKSFDGFFNGVMLRRPGRLFGNSDLNTLKMEWAHNDLKSFIRDPRLATTLRIFTRDIGYLDDQVMPAAAEAPPPPQPTYGQTVTTAPAMSMAVNPYQPETQVVQETSLLHPDVDDWHFTGYHGQPSAGVGGWNDFSGASDAARDLLDESAKIEIPKAEFVLKVLCVYLLVLVPLNWLMFWLMGRVEWSWAAAPVIAIVGAVCVIRLAQLNVGFVRSRTEIAVMEVQGDYKRAHVTRYTTLYTSLSTAYSATFDDPAALSLPFVVDENWERKPNEWPQLAEFHRDKTTRLTGVQVNSNSTEKIHSEHMLELKGPISLVGDEVAGLRLKNATQFTFHDLGVIRRRDNASGVGFEVAYVKELRPQTMMALSFAPYQRPVEPQTEATDPRPAAASYYAPWVPQWDESVIMGPKTSEEAKVVRLHRMVDLAVKRLRINPGDVRLVAWTSDPVPGMHLSPRPAQNTTQTLLLAHLVRGKLPDPVRDANIADDIKVLDPLEEIGEDGTPIGSSGN